MSTGCITFKLADGELVGLNDDDIGGVSRELWTRSSQAGSTSTAALLHHEVQRRQTARRTIELTQIQSEALSHAIARHRFLLRR